MVSISRKAIVVPGLFALGVGWGGFIQRTAHAAPALSVGRAAPSMAAARDSSTTMDGVTLSVGAATRVKSGLYAIPPSYVIEQVRATLHNAGGVTYQYYSDHFRALNARALAYAMVPFRLDAGSPPRFLSGKLAPGSTVSGSMSFVMPANEPLAAIRWELLEIGADHPLNRVVRLPGAPALNPGGAAGSTTVAKLTVTLGPARTDSHAIGVLPGYVFDVVHVSIINHRAVGFAYNDLDFALLGPDGVAYGSDPDPSAKGLNGVGYGTVKPGATVAGDIGFYVRRGQTPVAMSWVPTLPYNDAPGDVVLSLPH